MLERWMGVLLRRWRSVPVPFGGPRAVREIRHRFHGVVPRPFLAVPRCIRLLLLLLLPVRRTSPMRGEAAGGAAAHTAEDIVA